MHFLDDALLDPMKRWRRQRRKNERKCCPLVGKDNNTSSGAFLSWRWHLPRADTGITILSRLLRDEL